MLEEGVAGAPRGEGDGPGRLDRLLALPDRLPGPALVWYALLVLAVGIGLHAPAWLTGARPVGTVEPLVLPGAAVFLYFLLFIYLLRRIAGRAFDRFEPALGGDPGQRERLRSELTRIPDRQAALGIAVAEVVLNAAYLAESQSQLRELPGALAAASILGWWFAIAVLAIAILLAVRQMRWVSRLHAMARQVDLFAPGPINAFSTLTATTAIGILPVALLFLTPEQEEQQLVGLASGFGLILLAVASFVLPLRGMHERLSAEKDRLLSGSHARLRLTLERIHSSVDDGDTSQAEQLQATLSSLLAERDVLTRLPSWPWSSGTFRGLASAVALPIVVWLITRLLERLV